MAVRVTGYVYQDTPALSDMPWPAFGEQFGIAGSFKRRKSDRRQAESLLDMAPQSLATGRPRYTLTGRGCGLCPRWRLAHPPPRRH